MQTNTQRVYVLGGRRTPFAKAGTQLARMGILEMMVHASKALVKDYKLGGRRGGELCVGAVIGHPKYWNTAREVVFDSGLSPETPATNLTRACATGLDAAINVANRIALGNIDWAVAGGADSASFVPLFSHDEFSRKMIALQSAKTLTDRLKIMASISLKQLKPLAPAITERTTGKTMGQHCELMAKEWGVTRSEQDELALASHVNAAKAVKEGFHKPFIAPLNGLEQDNIVRADTTLEKLGKLKPAFDRSEKGTLTAGNSTGLTDGGSVVLLGSASAAKDLGLNAHVFIRDYEVAAVDIQKDGLLMAPVWAMARMLRRQGLKLQDFDCYEIHEAFAAQVVCTLKAWESSKFCKDRLGLDQPLGSIDRRKLNIKGGSVAIGHPFAATGGRILMGAAKILESLPSGSKCLISICAGGGMGTVAILERE